MGRATSRERYPCSSAFNAGFSMHITQVFGSPVPVTKSALKVKCEHTVTVGSKPSNYLKEIEGV